MKHVDVILISNYRSILALPYITERSEFAGVVYATEPSLTLGRLYMEELVFYIERNPKLKRASVWKKPHVFANLQSQMYYSSDSTPPSSWQTIYSLKEVNNCLSKVKPVSFAEKTVRISYYTKFKSWFNVCILFKPECFWLFEMVPS